MGKFISVQLPTQNADRPWPGRDVPWHPAAGQTIFPRLMRRVCRAGCLRDGVGSPGCTQTSPLGQQALADWLALAPAAHLWRTDRQTCPPAVPSDCSSPNPCVAVNQVASLALQLGAWLASGGPAASGGVPALQGHPVVPVFQPPFLQY